MKYSEYCEFEGFSQVCLRVLLEVWDMWKQPCILTCICSLITASPELLSSSKYPTEQLQPEHLYGSHSHHHSSITPQDQADRKSWGAELFLLWMLSLQHGHSASQTAHWLVA